MATSPAEDGSGSAAARPPEPDPRIHWRYVEPLTPECRLLLYDIGKDDNLGMILRTAASFGVREATVVGRKPRRLRGDMGARDSIRLTRHWRLDEAILALRGEGFRVLAVEITPDALDIRSRPFAGPTAFLLGNEARGVGAAALELCDGQVYIPQHGQGQSSLNVGVACAIALHEFAAWAGYPELPRDAARHKFHVDWLAGESGSLHSDAPR